MLMNIVVSIPLRKFRKREGYHNENKTRPVSIPLRKFRKALPAHGLLDTGLFPSL